MSTINVLIENNDSIHSILIIWSTSECVVLKFNDGVFMYEGFVVNDQKVYGNHQTGHISYSEEQ